MSLWIIGIAAARLSSRVLQNLLIYIPAFCFTAQLVYFFFADEKSSFFWAHRLVLATDHPGVLAVLCVIPIFATLWKFQRAFAWLDVLVGIALPLAVLFFTYARASMLGVFVVFCFAALLNHRFRKIALASFAVVTVCGILFMPAQQKERFGQTLRAPLHQKTFLSRLPIWEATLNGIEQHPLLGNTHKSFRGHFERYVQEHKAELKSKYTFVEATQYHAHNIYLGLVYNWGIVGFALIAGLAGYALWTSGKMGLGYVWNCLLFLAVYGCFEFPFHRKDGAFLFFFALGLAYGRYAVWPRFTGASAAGSA
ncbi:O-antigen ligase family protein [Desulfobaculum bizertense]|uniref:O-antigen ligase family protein n=1 Tax=Desulfobaculum bizertense TaxID=376490 RepID=UPI001F478183|nr:O-antigen ligase family protein [Desulfobaculum bizertense]UIJ37027.1 O-antigen ligase family protein [Desulfobaculum bizertense]